MQKNIEIPADILYLVHITSKKYKDDNNKLSWKELKISSEVDQFPGCYFTLITRHNRLTEKLFPGKNCLIFSRNLLKQINYHINICDNNGFITEENTYFPSRLQEVVKIIKKNSRIPRNSGKVNYHLMNEVVFHNNVSLDYLCLDIPVNFISNKFLPEYLIENNTTPNMSLLPFYCFIYLVENNRYENSYSFYIKLAKVFNIDTLLSKEKIIEKIIEKSSYFNKNRHLQNINILL